MNTQTLAVKSQPKNPSDDARYQAIVRRDRAADGSFVYGVATTGVFCKPSCPSRRPNRANIELYADAIAAERAGYRPCKRCKPTASGDARAASVQKLVAQVCAIIDEADEAPTLERIAEAVGMSPYHLHRVFSAATGLTPRAYAKARRRERTQAALRTGSSVTRAIYDAGFGSSSRFYDAADENLGMSPSAFKDAGRGTQVRYAQAACALGHVIIAATVKGICFVALGDDAKALDRAVTQQFANALSVKEDARMAEWLAAIVRHLEDGSTLDLPLDVEGTIFQQRVWQAMRAIPSGTTVTYSSLADIIGKPKAIRAVAHACATNPVALLVPCHRVVGKDGKMHGYRWGVERKEKLLARERGEAKGRG